MLIRDNLSELDCDMLQQINQTATKHFEILDRKPLTDTWFSEIMNRQPLQNTSRFEFQDVKPHLITLHRGDVTDNYCRNMFRLDQQSQI